MSDFAFAGYLITTRFTRPDKVAPQRFAAEMITASGCFIERLPDTWTLSWGNVRAGEREQRLSDFAITIPFEEVARQADELFAFTRVRWPSFIQDAEAVRQFLALVGDRSRVRVLGLGLHASLVGAFLKDHLADDVQSLGHALAQHRPLPTHGALLGYEPLAFEQAADDAHSWHCNGLPAVLLERQGMQPNAHGLLDDYDVAKAWCEEIERDGLGEPLPWIPWMLLDCAPAHTRPSSESV